MRRFDSIDEFMAWMRDNGTSVDGVLNASQVADILDVINGIAGDFAASGFSGAARRAASMPRRARAGRSPYAVLGLGATATRDEVKAAYRRLAQRHHPDHPGGSAAKMAEINAAYESVRRKVLI